MPSFDYEAFYSQIGRLNGWDFSHVKCRVEGESWDMYQEIADRCKPSDILLDIGTGGGEAVLPLANALLLLVGIDYSHEMIQTANRNARKRGASNVRFLQMSADHLVFPEHFFNLVSCRQSPFFAQEIANVLLPDGMFLTQQVAEDDKINLKQAFGRGQSFGIRAGDLRDRYLTELEAAGFREVEHFDIHTTEYYQTPEDLLFLLTHTPIIPDFGQDADDFRILHQFIQDNQCEKGIRTNASRAVIRAIR